MADWGTGTYELTAAQIEPVAGVVVDAAEPVEGLKTLDLACGTGNSALIAAGRGADVTGLDLAPRLLEVAGERAAAAGLSVNWTEGSLLDLPFEDDAFEIILSVFGVIFGDPAAAVAAEIARVLDQQGRIAITTWTNEGMLPEIAALSKGAVADALDLPPDQHEHFQWGDETALRGLFAENGIALQCESRSLEFTAASAEQARDEWAEHHPMWLALKATIGDDNFSDLAAKVLTVMEAGNESTTGGFSYTSSYLLALGSPV